nr:ubiquitin-specific protease 13 [Tanacetum cinerariifolium]
MDIRDEIPSRKGKLKVDSSFTKADEAVEVFEELEDEEVGFDKEVEDERVSDKEGNDAEEGVFDEEDEDYEAHESKDNKESKEDKGSKEVDETSELMRWLRKVQRVRRRALFQSLRNGSMFMILILCLKKRRTLPYSLFSSIRDSQVDMKSFLSNVGFSSLHNVFIDTLPARLARFVVRAFTSLSYEFKVDKVIIYVTLEKVHKILEVPLGETSIFDLPEIPLDDLFVKLWFKKFHPKPLTDIHTSDIARKLVLAKRVDFMFKVNFLVLFANVMGTADTMKVIVNLTVLRCIHEDTNISKIDWCGVITNVFKIVQNRTVNG